MSRVKRVSFEELAGSLTELSSGVAETLCRTRAALCAWFARNALVVKAHGPL